MLIVCRAAGVFGIPLSGAGIIWLVMPQKHLFFAKLSLYPGNLLVLLLVFIALLSSGVFWGLKVLNTFILVFIFIQCSQVNFFQI